MWFVILEDIDSVYPIKPGFIFSHAQMEGLLYAMEGEPVKCNVFASKEEAVEWAAFTFN